MGIASFLLYISIKFTNSFDFLNSRNRSFSKTFTKFVSPCHQIPHILAPGSALLMEIIGREARRLWRNLPATIRHAESVDDVILWLLTVFHRFNFSKSDLLVFKLSLSLLIDLFYRHNIFHVSGWEMGKIKE